MAQAKWRLEGEWIKNCNCAFGCPCDFNARATHGECKGMVGMHITKGHFNDLALDGLNFACVLEWPGALHEGNGRAQPIVDERASPEQRNALLEIMSGNHSDEGTLFRIFSMILSTVHDPIFAPFEFSFDRDARKARLNVPGVLDTDVEPIKNPVTGAPHRIQVVMPEGFEHRMGEVASSNITSSGTIRYQTRASHSTLANVVHTPHGVEA
jgi:hypothetical protein